MINDKTIDAVNAKYWCIFLDDEISKLLDKAQQYDKKDGQRLAKTLNMAKNSKKNVDEGMWDFAQAAHQAAFPMATGNPYQPNFRALDPSSGIPSLHDQAVNNVVAAGTAAALAGAAAAPGVWAGIASAFGAAGSWLLGTAASATASLGSAGIMAIVGGIVSVSSYLYPRIAKTIRDIKRSGIIAKCEFEADGVPYKAVFSLSKRRWELLYNNNRWIRSGTKVSPVDIQSFFSSKFFEKFLNGCKSHISKIYDDQKKLEQFEVISKMAESKSSKDIKTLIDAKDTIYSYMLNGQYVTETEEQES